jgi:lipopolysaccharide transport protein LptA
MKTLTTALLAMACGASWAMAQTSPAAKNGEEQGMEITASKEVSFDSAGKVAVFLGDVEVKDPQFDLKANRLTIYLAKEGGGLDRAEADGSVVIVSKRAGDAGSSGAASRGKAHKAVYDAKTGDITLIGWPQVQQGINLHVASEETTRMVLNRDGRMKTYGRSRTIIRDSEEERR